MKAALERAARALCLLDGHAPDIKMGGKPLWHDYLPEVQAVLQAIRVPDDAMIAAADSLACDLGTVAHWQAMVDAVRTGA